MPPVQKEDSERGSQTPRRAYLKPVLKEFGAIAVVTSKTDMKGERDGSTAPNSKT
jgi:hypothetical protein